jgi:Leucine-rich repeat (LRR) protein
MNPKSLKNKISQLLYAKETKNVLLAIQLAKSQNIDLNLKEYLTFDNSYSAKVLSKSILKEGEEKWINDQQIFSELVSILETTNLFYYVTEFEKIPFLKNLTHLSLCKMNSKKLPKGLYQLKNLEKLRILNSKLSLIEMGISKLSKLEKLILNNNEIKEIPLDISYLSKLKYLSLNCNKLNAFPKGILNLTKLEHLDISFNNIKTIPDQLYKMQNLKRLYIQQNPLPKTTIRKLIKLLPNSEIK